MSIASAQLLAEKPERARATGDGETLLMWLPPDDESRAMEVAQLLLDHGADATVRDPQRHDRGGSGGAERDVRGGGAAARAGVMTVARLALGDGGQVLYFEHRHV